MEQNGLRAKENEKLREQAIAFLRFQATIADVAVYFAISGAAHCSAVTEIAG